MPADAKRNGKLGRAVATGTPSDASNPMQGERARAVRERLIAAAITTFARYGYRQTSMELIAEQAAVSRQTLYNHFQNKDAIFSAGVQSLQTMSLNEARHAVERVRRAPRSDWIDELTAALVARNLAFVAMMRSTPHLGELTDEQNRLCGDIIAHCSDRFRASLIELASVGRGTADIKLKSAAAIECFVDDAIAISIGLKHLRSVVDADGMRTRLAAILRALRKGLAKP